MFPALRRIRPEVLLSHSCALLCGLAFTGICAVVGLCSFMSHTCFDAFAFDCHVERRSAERRVSAIAQAVILYQIEHNAVPKTKDDLVKEKYIPVPARVDRWGTSIAYRCRSSGAPLVRSAGPDKRFNTADDITGD
jgi:hypothetical protein